MPIMRLECVRVMYYLDIKQLRQKRLSLGIRSGEAADKLGVSPSQISHWELGTSHAPFEYLRKYAKMLDEAEASGEKRRALYTPNGKYKGALAKAHALSLRRTILWIGAKFDEIAGMAGIPASTFRRHMSGRNRMTMEEHTAISNVLYKLGKERDKEMPTKLITEARHMLTYYSSRVRQLHDLLTQAVMLKEGTDYRAQTYRGYRPSNGVHADPVYRRYSKIETVEELISKLSAKILPALRTYRALKTSSREEDREMFLIFERYYIEHDSIEDISSDTGISERTLYRRKYGLMCRIAEELKEKATVKSGEK